MTNDERLLLFYQIFPRLGLTIGELLDSEVLFCSSHVINVKQKHHIIVDLINKQWYKYPTPMPYQAIRTLADKELDKFWEDLSDMLLETSHQKPLMLKFFDPEDWYAWSGAEKPINSEPAINYDVKIDGFGEDFNIATVIMDANGIEIYLCNQDTLIQTERWYELAIEWPTGWTIISQMTEPLTPIMLQQLNFKQVS